MRFRISSRSNDCVAITANGVECVEFAIAPTHFVFRALLFGDVENKSLIALDAAGRIAGGKAALRNREQSSVLAANHHLEVPDVVVSFELLAKTVALVRARAQNAGQVESHQFVAVAVAQHGDKSIVAVEQVAFQRSNENSFLHLLEERAVLLFGQLALGGVVHNVDSPLCCPPCSA